MEENDEARRAGSEGESCFPRLAQKPGSVRSFSPTILRISFGKHRLQEQENFLLTPFERNIEVWRQLWRVLERSHLVVQIVDARNPLRFRCKDLEDYVRDVEGNEGEAGSGPGKRENMLLINKADLLTANQRYIILQLRLVVALNF